MNYEQLIEELREEMLQLVNTKCDALLQMHQSGAVYDAQRSPFCFRTAVFRSQRPPIFS